MKKIGFIDYYLNEWHADNYPEIFEKETNGEMKVCYAYGKIDAPNGMTNAEWAKEFGIELLDSIEEVVEKSDYIVVLSPDNPEMHMELTEIPLKSKKPVYVDKTFALFKAEAEAMLKNAENSGTPCYSSSALYFSDELQGLKKEGITRINSIGSGDFDTYAIHQIEQIVYLMGFDAKRVMYMGENEHPSLLIEFEGGRYAQMTHFKGQPFGMTVGYEDGTSANITVTSDFFGNCMKNMAKFFETEKAPIPHEQTLTVVAIIEAGHKARNNPFEWVEV